MNYIYVFIPFSLHAEIDENRCTNGIICVASSIIIMNISHNS